MKSLPAIALALVAAAVAAAVWFVERPEPAAGDAGAKVGTTSGAAAEAGSTSASSAAAGPASTGREGEGAGATAPPAEDGVRRVAGADVPRWPTAQAKEKAQAKAKAAGLTGEPAVAFELAAQALALVGIDPEAERTWRRAIDDAHMPANVRSDLIEDLNQEGFVDNSHPTSADLPLVLARLELIERLTPLARDDTNRAAFAEAYKDLLAMYVRLGGQPRPAPATAK